MVQGDAGFILPYVFLQLAYPRQEWANAGDRVFAFREEQVFTSFHGYVVVATALCSFALALSGCGGGSAGSRVVPEPAATIDWLAPADARGVFEAAYAHRSGSGPSDPERSYTVDDRPLWLPRPDSAGAKEWDYWNRPYLSADITKIQARPAPGAYESPGNDSRAVYGILDHGVFWIATDDQPEGDGYFGAGYYYLDKNRYRLPADTPPPDAPFVAGASWRGDALGMVKSSGRPVSGPAVLTMTSVEESADAGRLYGLRLDVAFRNVGVDRVELNAASDGEGGFGASSPGEAGYRLQGTFLGSEAEEASGTFETLIYYGAFGVKR